MVHYLEKCRCCWSFKHCWKADGAIALNESCTVTIAHSRTVDLPDVVRNADIVVAAVGKPEMVPGDWLNLERQLLTLV